LFLRMVLILELSDIINQHNFEIIIREI